MYLVKIFALFLFGFTSIECQNAQCKKDAKKMSDLLSDFFLLAAPSRNFPINQVEFKAFCKEDKTLAAKIKTISNTCLDKTLKRLVSLFTYSTEKTNINICRSKRKGTEFIEMGKCANSVNKENIKCWDQLMRTSSGIPLVKDVRQRLPLACCAIYSMKSCFVQNYENSKNCNRIARNGLENLFGSYLTDTMRLMCGEYTEDNDKCDKIIKALPRNKSKKLDSIISLAWAIFDGIPDDIV